MISSIYQLAREGYGWQDIQSKLQMNANVRQQDVWDIICKVEKERNDGRVRKSGNHLARASAQTV